MVVVSAAAGATGSVVGQIARARGAAKVVGIAGGPEKCAEVVERYRFDACLDYREDHLRDRLRDACPTGIDLYFDNVGGEILDTVLTVLALRARVVLCGAISQYNATGPRRGIENTSALITRRARMEGFLILDYASRFAEAQGGARWARAVGSNPASRGRAGWLSARAGSAQSSAERREPR